MPIKRRSRSLGPANENIPKDELYLAKLIQNAASRGLKSTTGAFYRRTRSGHMAACCAAGAAQLEHDTERWGEYPGITHGNDSVAHETSYFDGSGFTVGQSFRHARR